MAMAKFKPDFAKVQVSRTAKTRPIKGKKKCVYDFYYCIQQKYQGLATETIRAALLNPDLLMHESILANLTKQHKLVQKKFLNLFEACGTSEDVPLQSVETICSVIEKSSEVYDLIIKYMKSGEKITPQQLAKLLGLL